MMYIYIYHCKPNFEPTVISAGMLSQANAADGASDGSCQFLFCVSLPWSVRSVLLLRTSSLAVAFIQYPRLCLIAFCKEFFLVHSLSYITSGFVPFVSKRLRPRSFQLVDPAFFLASSVAEYCTSYYPPRPAPPPIQTHT